MLFCSLRSSSVFCLIVSDGNGPLSSTCFSAPVLSCCWVCNNLQRVPRPTILLWYCYGWHLKSRLGNGTRKSPCRSAWSGIRCHSGGTPRRVPYRSSDKPLRRSSLFSHLARSLLDLRGTIRLCCPHSSPCAREWSIPSYHHHLRCVRWRIHPALDPA